MSLERQTAEVKKQERLASDRVDRDIIMKAQKSIMNLALARSHRGKKAPVSKEVADALNILADALSLSASRVRLRTLHDKDDFVFRRRRDHRNLNVPLIVAEPDEHTLDDSSEDDESQVEEIDAPKGPKAPPKKSEGKRNVPDKSTPAEVQKPKLTLKQKGKARQPDPASPSSSENDSPVRLLEDGPKEPDTTITKKTAEPVDASAEIERPIPRPRPIAKKTRREVPDEQPVPSVVPEANADVVVPDIPMSPLSQMDEDTPNDPAHHAVDQNAQDDTVVAPPSLPLVTPDELAEEIDTLRRSSDEAETESYCAFLIRGHTAPSSTHGLSRGASAHIRGSTAATADSSSSKRSRNQALLTSPQNKKKAKRSSVYTNADESEEEETMPGI
ncbi:hypothetical protein DFH29DRAFT_1008682 [Suillus ampliporus]|nr:hypothetical protein DFH29DRAFT_1008682 [Suillus ampliporus]